MKLASILFSLCLFLPCAVKGKLPQIIIIASACRGAPFSCCVYLPTVYNSFSRLCAVVLSIHKSYLIKPSQSNFTDTRLQDPDQPSRNVCWPPITEMKNIRGKNSYLTVQSCPSTEAGQTDLVRMLCA